MKENFNIKAFYVTFPFGWEYYFDSEKKREEFIKEKEKERSMYVVSRGQAEIIFEDNTIYSKKEGEERKIIDNLPVEFLDRLDVGIKIFKKKKKC